MSMQQLSASQVSPEVPINENFETVEHQAVYGKRHPATTGLTWAYYGGRWGGTSIADGTVTLTNAATNYLVVERSTGTLSGSTATTNWDNPSLYARAYKLTTAGSVVTATEDHRAGPLGVHGDRTLADLQGSGTDVDAAGFRGVPQNSQSGNYTTVAADAGKHILHPSGGGSGDTITIASNASVAYEVGTALTFVNLDSNAVSLAITSDTLYLAGTGGTGTRSLAQYGVATALKITSTAWLISGTGLS
ncbi:MAG: hypothetical protein MUC86_07135 [Burkholderiaceae bacterium]|jgi:hypothetical protein|nr:hypothetical protein [Burkholderiaceae bacterium]